MKAEDDTRKVLRLSFDSFSIPTFEQPLTEDKSVLFIASSCQPPSRFVGVMDLNR